eukprot:10079379-Lingulodinium_polyedra.AAC.1
MNEILAAISFARRDRRFALGQYIMKRKDGWPMGGHMSASATTVTLEYDIARMYKYRDRLERMEWDCPSLPTEAIVQ